MIRKSQKAIFVLIGDDAFDVIGNPSNPLFPLINAVSLAGPKPDDVNPDNYLFVPGSENNRRTDGNINSKRYEKFLATIPLHGPTGAMALNQLSYVSLVFFPWFMRLTAAQMTEEVPSYLPNRMTTDEEENVVVLTWEEWLARKGTPAQINNSTDFLAGDMANYGSDVDLEVARQLQEDGYTVLDRSERLGIELKTGELE